MSITYCVYLQRMALVLQKKNKSLFAWHRQILFKYVCNLARSEHCSFSSFLQHFFLLFSEKRNLKHFLNKKTVIKTIYFRLENAAIVAKSDMSASKLRYEQQVYNLQTEISSQQVNRRNLCF